ncbi:hypothetical protein MYX07_05090 [Patescibacteria group bacterium AH-259-L07]|nr:hypothetical protein [Patescibacteria group bacterium AH-259-L07]
MKRFIGLSMAFLILASMGVGQTTKPEIWKVQILNDSTFIVKTQSATTFSYGELVFFHTVNGLSAHSALSSRKDIGTEVMAGLGFLLYGSGFLIETIDLFWDIVTGEKITKKGWREKFITLAVDGVMTYSYTRYFVSPGATNPTAARIANTALSASMIHYLSKKYAGK